MWTPFGGRMAHITAQGTVTFTPAPLPDCRDSELGYMVRAADGAMWIGDFGCDRLLRVTPEGTTTVPVPTATFAALAADASGGLWFSLDGGVGHADAAGAVRRFALPLGSPSAIAAGADGTAWLAHGGCRLTRIDPSGSLTTAAAPVPAYELALDESGRLLLASRTRLVRFTPGGGAGPCDETGPRLRARPGGRRISLAALRRGFRISVDERALVGVVAEHLGPSPDAPDALRRRRTRGAETFRYRLPPSSSAATRDDWPRVGGRASCSAPERSTPTATRPRRSGRCA